MLDAIGVYVIRCSGNGGLYVGSASLGVKRRWHIHKSDLKKGKHHNSRMQRAWDKYGEESFTITVAEVCLPQHCVAQEQVYMDYYRQQVCERMFNLHPTAGNARGSKRTPEQRARLSEIAYNIPPEQRERMRLALKGQKRSEEVKARMRKLRAEKNRFTSEVRQKMSESAKRRRHSPETIEKIRLASSRRMGVPLSEEAKKKIGDANRGRVMSAEQKAKLSEITRNMSDEQRKKIGDKARGRVDSPETRERRRVSQTARHARERAAREAKSE